MATQSNAEHVLSLRLETGSLESDDTFQLNRKRFSNLGLIIVTTLETERTITLVCDGLDGGRKRLDLLECLKSGLIELVESSKKSVVSFTSPIVRGPGTMEIPPKPSPQHYQVRAGLRTDTTFELWKEMLHPEHTYELRISEDKGKVWAYDNVYDGPPEDIPSSQRLSVGREKDTIHFKVGSDPAPPNLFAKLEVPQECNLSGRPPFTFVIEYSTDSQQPITINKSRSPLSTFWLDLKSVSQLIHCTNSKTGEKVDWPATFGCFDSDPHPKFPEDSDFVEVLLDKPWRFEHTLARNESAGVGSLENLQAGVTYEAQVAEDALDHFHSWQFGRKADLLAGTDEEKKQRWKIDMKKQGVLEAVLNNGPVTFKTVA